MLFVTCKGQLNYSKMKLAYLLITLNIIEADTFLHTILTRPFPKSCCQMWLLRKLRVNLCNMAAIISINYWIIDVKYAFIFTIIYLMIFYFSFSYLSPLLQTMIYYWWLIIIYIIILVYSFIYLIIAIVLLLHQNNAIVV